MTFSKKRYYIIKLIYYFDKSGLSKEIKTDFNLCLSFLEEYKVLLYEYHLYMSYLNELSIENSKIKQIDDALSIISYWASYFLYIDGYESIYFVWKIDHRGRV